jgi:hypothetical protein
VPWKLISYNYIALLEHRPCITGDRSQILLLRIQSEFLGQDLLVQEYPVIYNAIYVNRERLMEYLRCDIHYSIYISSLNSISRSVEFVLWKEDVVLFNFIIMYNS